MTVKELIIQLIAEGHKITYRERSEKEGKGVRITSIDGVHYTGSEGNKEARAILGVKLSQAQTEHLEKIRVRKGRFGSKKRDTIPDEVKKKIAKVQRMFRKKGTKEGMPTYRNYRYVMKHFSKEEADRLLESASRYVRGVAYLKNIQMLIERMNNDLTISYDSNIERARNIVRDYYNVGAPNFLESQLADIIDALYEWEQTYSDKAKSRAVLSLVMTYSTTWK